MKTLILAAIRCSLIFTAVAALSIAYPASVQSVPTTYQYTGNPFTVVTAPYTTSDFVTVMLTLAGPLPPNMFLTEITPIAYTFSDGVQTLTPSNSHIETPFMVATLGGTITEWAAFVRNATGGAIVTQTDVELEGFFIDQGSLLDLVGPRGFNFNAPGTWKTVGSVADTGSTLSLMTLTFMALGVAARQFKRAAA
jgi:hypothetical protein